jgi:hypothetical protein
LTQACTVLLFSALLGIAVSTSRAESFLLAKARVIWAQGDRIYIASLDSVALEPTTGLTFRDRHKTVATGEVTTVYGGELIAARLTSGSLQKVKHLDRVEITAHPPEFRPPPLLRVGYPAAGRKHPLIDCSGQTPDTTFLQGAYAWDAIGSQSYRLVRDPSYSIARSWPDTLLVRLFDEVSDEEIALERGDLDVAIFRPGEASPHIREAMHWEGRPLGRWSSSSLTVAGRPGGDATAPEGLTKEAFDALTRLNQEMFRGDLIPLPDVEVTTQTPPIQRFEVGSSIPGYARIQRFLDQAMPPVVERHTARVLRLQVRGPSQFLTFRPQNLTYISYYLGCPVISSIPIRPYVETLEQDALANLFQCLPTQQEP